MRSSFVIVVIVLILCSCESKEKPYKDEGSVTWESEFRKEINGIKTQNDSLLVWLSNIYGALYFEPIWSDKAEPTKSALEFIKTLSSSSIFGLDSSYYKCDEMRSLVAGLLDTNQVPSIDKVVEFDLLLTQNYLLFAKHLHCGVLDSSKQILELKSYANRQRWNASDVLVESVKENTIIKSLLEVQPQNNHYRACQKALESWLKKVKISNTVFHVPTQKSDSLLAFALAKEALVLLGYEDTSSQNIQTTIKEFQILHGLSSDGVIGTNTANALSKSAYAYYKQAAINLERWKWQNEWGENYFFVNIPAFKIRAIQGHEIVREHRVIVGNPKAETPEFNDSIRYLIAFPYWNVPESIVLKEFVPKIKKDSTFFIRNRYELVDQNNLIVDYYTVDWNTFTKNHLPYRIRQKGGGGNALGVIKFIFPNKHMVYLHDTPTKMLFNNEVRTYSHGCIRLENPLDLAAYLLDFDENSTRIDSVKAYIKKEKRTHISLKTPYPIKIHYFTCEGDEKGNLIFYNDVYMKDEKLIQTIFSDKNSL